MTVNIQGFGNSLVTPELIAREHLMRLSTNLIWAHLATFALEKYFESKIGDQITIVKPQKSFVNRGRVIDASKRSPLINETVQVKVKDRFNVVYGWSDQTATLTLDQFMKNYARDGMELLAYVYDQSSALEMGRSAPTLFGVPGSNFPQDRAAYLSAHAADISIPRDMKNAFCVLNTHDKAAFNVDLSGAAGQSGKYNEAMVRTAIESSYMGETSDWPMFSSVHMPTQQVLKPAGMTTPMVNASATNTDTIPTDGWGVNNTKVLKKGQIITFKDVYEVKPRSWDLEQENLDKLETTGRLKTFTVTADVTTNGAGAASIPISPEINDGTNTKVDQEGNTVVMKALQNVSKKPANDTQITIVGQTTEASGTVTYRQVSAFHRDALCFVPIELAATESAVVSGVVEDEQTGLSISYLQGVDFNTKVESLRLDVMFAQKNIYPELSMRVWTSTVSG